MAINKSPGVSSTSTGGSISLPPLAAGTGIVYTGSTGTISLSAPFDTLPERIDAIEKQLLILRPSLELHEKYPALKEAYEAYLLVLNMVKN